MSAAIALTAMMATLLVFVANADAQQPSIPEPTIDQIVAPEVFEALEQAGGRTPSGADQPSDEPAESLTNPATVEVLVVLDQADFETDTSTDAGQGALEKGIDDLIDQTPAGTVVTTKRWDSVRGFVAETTREGVIALAKSGVVDHIDLDSGASHSLLDPASEIVGFGPVQADGFTGRGQQVAILDSGIDASHRDLSDSVLSQACFAEGGAACPGGSRSARDDTGHGTMVAGVIASNGVVAPRGGTPDVGIHAIKVLDANGSTSSALYVIDGLDHVIKKLPSVGVVNISIGSWDLFAGSCDDAAGYTRLYADAIETLRARGTQVVAAAGNVGDSNRMSAPACISSAIAVGATYSSGVSGIHTEACTSTNTPKDAATCYSNASAVTDVFAPGSFVLTSYPNDRVASASGTSFAAPIVTACIAAIHQADPVATPDEVENWIHMSSIKIRYGGRTFPRLDCATAVGRAEAAKQTVMTPFPDSDLSVSTSCHDMVGDVGVTIHNMADRQVSFEVVLDNMPARQLNVGAGRTVTTVFTGRPDGLYGVRINVGATLIANKTARVACDDEVVLTKACAGANGQIKAKIANHHGAVATYTLTVGGRSISTPVAPDEVTMLMTGGLADTTYDVVVSRDGSVIRRQQVGIDCDIAAETKISSVCDNNAGRIDTAVHNTMGVTENYRVRVTGLTTKAITLNPGRSYTMSRGGRPDGVYVVEVLRGNTSIASKSVTIDCGHVGEVAVKSQASCLAGKGRVDLRLSNLTTHQSEFVVKVGPHTRTETVPAAQVASITISRSSNGNYPVVVTQDGAVIHKETIKVSCE